MIQSKECLRKRTGDNSLKSNENRYALHWNETKGNMHWNPTRRNMHKQEGAAKICTAACQIYIHDNIHQSGLIFLVQGFPSVNPFDSGVTETTLVKTPEPKGLTHFGECCHVYIFDKGFPSKTSEPRASTHFGWCRRVYMSGSIPKRVAVFWSID